jgi:hypothetical protein
VRGRILQQHELLPGVVGRQVCYAVAAAIAPSYTRWNFPQKSNHVVVATEPPEPEWRLMNGFGLSKSVRTLVHGVALIEIERVPACPAVVFYGRERLRVFIHRVGEWDYPPVSEFVKTAHTPLGIKDEKEPRLEPPAIVRR